MWSAVAYHTVGAHLIEGEERMRVVWVKKNPPSSSSSSSSSTHTNRGLLSRPFLSLPTHPPTHQEDEVWFEVLSVARGHGWVGEWLFGLNRGMQTKFFSEQLRGMERAVGG